MRFNKYQPYGPKIVQNILSVRKQAHYVARIVVENDTGVFHYNIASNVCHDPVRITDSMTAPITTWCCVNQLKIRNLL